MHRVKNIDAPPDPNKGVTNAVFQPMLRRRQPIVVLIHAEIGVLITAPRPELQQECKPHTGYTAVTSS